MQTYLIEKLKYLLTSKGLTIAVAESLTCGRLQTILGSVSGSSDFFEGGITAYNLQQKSKLLTIDADLLHSVDCVSEQIASLLAKQACQLFGSDIGIGTTGYAEPAPEKQINTAMAYYAICHYQHNQAIIINGYVAGEGLDRLSMQQKVADSAILNLISYLETLNTQQ